MPVGQPRFVNSDQSLAHSAAIANVSGTAGGTYTATEQALITSLQTAVNGILAALRSNGTIAS